MKKLFCILTVITLLFCILAPVTTSAQSTPELPENTPLFLESAIKGGLMEYTDDIALKLEIYDRLYSALMNCETSIDVSDLSLNWIGENHQMIFNTVDYVVNTTPALYYSFGLSTDLNPAWNENLNDWCIESITLNFSGTDFDTLKNRLNTTQKLVSDIVKKVPKNLTDIAKMLWVHDYLAVNYKYDETHQIRSAFGFLTQKTGVCSSYAHTFTAIMTELGIPATSAYSDEGNHQWNIVLLDGKYYHIDCTWGDPTPDSYGTAVHGFFLLSDSQLDINDAESSNPGSHINDYTMESRYFGIGISCIDTKYDSGYIWNSYEKAFPCYNGEFYYISDTSVDDSKPTATIYKTSDFKTSQVVFNFTSSLWSFTENSLTYYHPGFYTSFEIIGSQLYFNDSHSVKYYDLANKQSGTVFDYNSDNIFSFHYLGKGKFSYTTHNHAETTTVIENTITLTDKGHICDSTSDSYNLDLIAMRKYLLGNHDDNICLVKGDLSGDDSVVNILDFVALKKLAAQ